MITKDEVQVIYCNPPHVFHKITIERKGTTPVGRTSDQRIITAEPNLYEFFGDRPVVYLKKLRRYAIIEEE